MGLSLSLPGLKLGDRATSGGGAAPATATMTLTPLASYEEKRIYQRSTTTGGGNGKGTGTIPVTLNASVAGTVNARTVTTVGGSTVVQTQWQLTIAGTGSQTFPVTGVDAFLGWAELQLQDSTGNWQGVGRLVGMGGVFVFTGQSQMVRIYGRQDGQTATYASLGITPSPNSSTLMSYNDSNAYQPTIATQAWLPPGDYANGSGPNGCGIGQFLNQMIAMLGINCGAIGHSAGGNPMSAWDVGGAVWTRLIAYYGRAGGWEGMVYGQGGTDGSYGVPAQIFSAGLNSIFTRSDALNLVRGSSYYRHVWAIPAVSGSIFSAPMDSPYERMIIRRGCDSYASAFGARHVMLLDPQQVDGIHESQVGSVTMGNTMYRYARGDYGLSAGEGPEVLSVSRVGAVLTVTLTDVGQTALVLTGTPGNRIWVLPKGYYNKRPTSDNRFPVSSVSSPNKTTLTVTLANDPGDGHELNFWMYWPMDPSDPTVDNIRDNRTDGDGISVGRCVKANSSIIAIPPPTPGGTVNAPPGGFVVNTSPFSMAPTSATYAASDGGAPFGQQLTGGTGISPAASIATYYPVTAEGFFTCPTIGVAQALFTGFGNASYIFITTGGKIAVGNAGVTGATTLVAGRRYHVAFCGGPNGRAIYLTDITSGTPGVRDAFTAGAVTAPTSPGRAEFRQQNGSSPMSGGAVDEWAVFCVERYSGTTYTCPTAPFTGSEANIVSLYHADNNTLDVINA